MKLCSHDIVFPRHSKNVFTKGELSQDSVVAKLATAAEKNMRTWIILKLLKNK